MILLEVGNLNGLFTLIIAIMFGPAILLAGIGLMILRKERRTDSDAQTNTLDDTLLSQPKRKSRAKVFFILAAVYLLISLGLCGTMLA